MRLVAVLHRITHEDRAERLPGRGWRFLRVLDSAAAYDQEYRLRILLEPASTLEPTRTLDEAALRRCRAEHGAQQRALEALELGNGAVLAPR